MEAPFDRGRIELIVAALADRLVGDWLLLGGAVTALWLEALRTTEDIDLVAIGAGAQRLDLLGAASDLGLPVEAVNSAADYFVERIPGWRGEIELLRAGSRGRIFRPTPTLFLLLKAGRLSARDLDDCLAAIARVRADRLALDAERVLSLLQELPPGAPDLEARRAALRTALNGVKPR